MSEVAYIHMHMHLALACFLCVHTLPAQADVHFHMAIASLA